jgi:hypothetical protein
MNAMSSGVIRWPVRGERPQVSIRFQCSVERDLREVTIAQNGCVCSGSLDTGGRGEVACRSV